MVTKVLFLLFTCASFFSYAQENNYQFVRINSAHGLSQSSVICIDQDSHGVMWIGTRDGLNNYDGERFRTFRYDPDDSTTLTNNDILDIHVGPDDRVWTGTNYGLSVFDPKTGRFQRYYSDPGNANSVAGNMVREIYTNDQFVLIGTQLGLSILTLGTGLFTHYKSDETNPHSLPHNEINDIQEGADGNFWIATANGLCLLKRKKNGAFTISRVSISLFDTRPTIIQKITIKDDKELIIGTQNQGAYIFSIHQNKVLQHIEFPEITSNDVRDVAFDDDGNIWLGTYDGLNILNENYQVTVVRSQKNDKRSLSKNTIKCVYRDDQGSMWIGVYYGGIDIWNKANFNFNNLTRNSSNGRLSYDVVSAITGYQEQIYVGTEGGGITILGKDGDSYLNTGNSRLPSDNVKSLSISGDELLIGTFNQGCAVYNLDKKRFSHFYNTSTGLSSNSVYAMLKVGEKYWIGTFGAGLYVGDPSNNSLERIEYSSSDTTSLSDNLIRVLFLDSEGNLLVGTPDGLNVLKKEDLDKGNYVFRRYLHNHDDRSGQDVLCIFEDSNGMIWVGTKENGSHYFKEEKIAVANLFNETSSFSRTVHAIEEDEAGDFWISTNDGIVQYIPGTGSWKRYEESDGLSSNEFNNSASYKSGNGTIYFGGPEGLSYTNPSQIVNNEYKPKVLIRELLVSNQPVVPGDQTGILTQSISLTETITLAHYQSIFAFRFASPSYVNPDKNAYAYRLLGLSDEFVVTDENTANFTIQNPGRYVFEVKGRNSDGIWSDQVTSVIVDVKPAPWRTPWVFALYAIAILAALYYLNRIIQNQARLKHELELEHQRTEQEKRINKLKLEFFTNISHEFRTPLTLITGPLQKIIQKFQGSRTLYKQLMIIERNADHLLKLINQLMDFRKLENNESKLLAAEGDLVKFVKEICLSFKSFAKSENYKYHFKSKKDEVPVCFDRDKMERILFNLISNAFKYTPPGGSVTVELIDEADVAKIIVSDTGHGIAMEELSRIFNRFYQAHYDTHEDTRNRGSGIGLALVKGLVELHGGTVCAESDGIDMGSKFIVTLKKGTDHLTRESLISNFENSESINQYQLLVPQEKSDLPGVMTPIDGQKKILVVEDNDQLRNFIADILKDYQVLTAANGKEGLEVAFDQLPDIIISDVMMPGMDGITLCSEIKSNLVTSHIPVILLTARTSLIFKYEGLESGADDYINKPFDVREFLLKIKNMLDIIEKLRDRFKTDGGIIPSEVTLTSIDEELMTKAIQIVDQNISNEFFDLSLFCTELGVSRTMLFSKVKAWTNMTPKEFILSMRMKRAAQLLEQGKATVSKICYEVGYTNPKYFSRSFQKYYGMPPTEYANKFKNIDV